MILTRLKAHIYLFGASASSTERRFGETSTVCIEHAGGV